MCELQPLDYLTKRKLNWSIRRSLFSFLGVKDQPLNRLNIRGENRPSHQKSVILWSS